MTGSNTFEARLWHDITCMRVRMRMYGRGARCSIVAAADAGKHADAQRQFQWAGDEHIDRAGSLQ